MSSAPWPGSASPKRFPHGAASWPWATFAVNMAGALALGLFVGALRGHRAESPGFALLTTGLCGTLTTFATFQLELFEMFEAGSAGLAIAYAAVTVVAGYLLVGVGISVGGPGRGMSAGGWIAVALLGGLAAVARFAIDALLSDHPAQPFPLGILVVNLGGTLVLGVVAGAALHGEGRTIVAGGVTGSLTTFSTWMLDSERLASADRAGLARLNVALSLVAGFAAVALGHWLGGVF